MFIIPGPLVHISGRRQDVRVPQRRYEVLRKRAQGSLVVFWREKNEKEECVYDMWLAMIRVVMRFTNIAMEIDEACNG